MKAARPSEGGGAGGLSGGAAGGGAGGGGGSSGGAGGSNVSKKGDSTTPSSTSDGSIRLSFPGGKDLAQASEWMSGFMPPGGEVLARMNIMSKGTSKAAAKGLIPYLPTGDEPWREEELPDWEGDVWRERQGQVYAEHLTLSGYSLAIRRSKDGPKPLKTVSLTEVFAVVQMRPSRESSEHHGPPSSGDRGAEQHHHNGWGFVIVLADGGSLEFLAESRRDAGFWAEILDGRVRGVRHYMDSIREGNLLKLSKSTARWISRWFILRGGTLFYYLLPGGGGEGGGGLKETSVRTFEIKSVKACSSEDGTRPYCLHLSISRHKSDHRWMTVDCGELSNMESWKAVLLMAMRRYPVSKGNIDVIGWDSREGERSVVVKGLASMCMCNITQVACGRGHAIAMSAEGIVLTWGEGRQGQLGQGYAMSRGEPTRVMGIPAAKQIDSSDFISACISEKGQLFTWGTIGDCAPDWSPRSVSCLDPVRQVSCGLGHLAAVVVNGDLFAWGEGFAGQLGLGDAESRMEPTKVEMPREGGGMRGGKGRRGRVLMVSCGVWHTLALTDQGHVMAWGGNDSGQLGLGSKEACQSPRLVSGFTTDATLGEQPVKLLCAGSSHSCAVTAMGHVFTWGKGEQGQLGIGPARLSEKRPTYVEGLSDVGSVSVSQWTCAAVTRSGKLFTWGKGGVVYPEEEEGGGGGGGSKDVCTPRVAGKLQNRCIQACLRDSFGLVVCHTPVPPLVARPSIGIGPGINLSSAENVSATAGTATSISGGDWIHGQSLKYEPEHYLPIEDMTSIMHEAENLAREGIISARECEEQRRQIFQASVEHLWAGVRKGWTKPSYTASRSVCREEGRGRGEADRNVGEMEEPRERESARVVGGRSAELIVREASELRVVRGVKGRVRMSREEAESECNRRVMEMRALLEKAYDDAPRSMPLPKLPPLREAEGGEEGVVKGGCKGLGRRLPQFLERYGALHESSQEVGLTSEGEEREVGAQGAEEEWGEFVAPKGVGLY